jgi:hypothetical protein
MYAIRGLLRDQGYDFALAYEPQPLGKTNDACNVSEFFAAFEAMETQAKAARRLESLASPER